VIDHEGAIRTNWWKTTKCVSAQIESIEIIDDGSAGTPVVKGDLYAAEGHGLFLVQHLAAQWGYLRDPAGTTVWFHLPAADQPQRTPAPADLQASGQARHRPARPDRARGTQIWAAAIQPTPA
jgi:hypothetical protein